MSIDMYQEGDLVVYQSHVDNASMFFVKRVVGKDITLKENLSISGARVFTEAAPWPVRFATPMEKILNRRLF